MQSSSEFSLAVFEAEFILITCSDTETRTKVDEVRHHIRKHCRTLQVYMFFVRIENP